MKKFLWLLLIIILSIGFIGFLNYTDVFTEKGQEFRRGKGPTQVENAIMNISGSYAKIIGNRDYKNSSGKEEFQYFTERLADELVNQKSPENTVSYYQTNQLTTEYETVRYKSLIIKGQTAEICFFVRLRILNASDTFLKINKLKKDNVYEQSVQQKLVNGINGVWKIDQTFWDKTMRPISNDLR